MMIGLIDPTPLVMCKMLDPN